MQSWKIAQDFLQRGVYLNALSHQSVVELQSHSKKNPTQSLRKSTG